MTPPTEKLNQHSRRFMGYLLVAALGWALLGGLLHLTRIADLIGFIQIFLFTFLDLIFLILIFWKVFFAPPEQSGRVLQIVIFLFFKLVCLGFLAITLKRLRNAPLSVIFMGIGFIWIGPLIAGLLSRQKHKD